MQTFLPYPDFFKSAQCLDTPRLGKQRVEAYQMVRHGLGVMNPNIERRPKAWANHPANLMWKGHLHSLVHYGLVICQVWRERGYNDTVLDKLLAIDASMAARQRRIVNELPPAWFGDERFHASHRSNLLRKNPDWYGQFGWEEGPELPYFWPTHNEEYRVT